MENEEHELGKKEGPVGLASEKFLFGVEICKVIMVGPYFKRFQVAFKVVAESFKRMNDHKEFLIVDIVVLFCGLE